MADFCRQCSIELLGEDFKDLAGFRTPEMEKDETYPLVLCEGCGPILVDNDGSCVCDDCSRHGHKA